MRKWIVAIVYISILLGFTPGVFCDGIKAGFAKTEITPPIGGNTTGYSSAKPTDGVHDPLFAKVLILQSSGTVMAIVSWDSCIFNSPWLHDQMADLGIDHLLLLNTHTHAGANLNQMDFPSTENPWRKTVEQRTLEAIKEAQSNMFSAFFSAENGAIQLGYNRLVRQPEGHSLTQFENPDRIPVGPVDPTVGVIRITDDAGKNKVVLVCYACHPVVLGPKNRKISADYPGVMCREVEKELGDGVQCIFIQGGAGDINPLILARTGDAELDFPLVERMGTLLSEEVIKTFKRMEDVEGKSECFSYKSKTLETTNRWEPESKMPISVTSVLINQEIGIVTMPGEPFHKFQVDLRNKSTLPHTYFFGYCCDSPHDWARYIPDLESAARSGYGASDTTIVEVGTGERLINQGLVMLYEMRGKLIDKPQRVVK